MYFVAPIRPEAASCIKPLASCIYSLVNQWKATLRNDVRFVTVYPRIYGRKFMTLSNQRSRCICKCIRIVYLNRWKTYLIWKTFRNIALVNFNFYITVIYVQAFRLIAHPWVIRVLFNLNATITNQSSSRILYSNFRVVFQIIWSSAAVSPNIDVIALNTCTISSSQFQFPMHKNITV